MRCLDRRRKQFSHETSTLVSINMVMESPCTVFLIKHSQTRRNTDVRIHTGVDVAYTTVRHTQTWHCRNIHEYLHAYMHSYITYIHTFVHTYGSICIHITYIQTCMYAHTDRYIVACYNIITCIGIYIHICRGLLTLVDAHGRSSASSAYKKRLSQGYFISLLEQRVAFFEQSSNTLHSSTHISVFVIDQLRSHSSIAPLVVLRNTLELLCISIHNTKTFA